MKNNHISDEYIKFKYMCHTNIKYTIKIMAICDQ